MTAPIVHAIELGGTKCVASLAHGSDIAESARVPTTTPAETLAALAAVLARWPAPNAIGIASFGPVMLTRDHPHHGRILATPKPGWAGADLMGALARPGVPIALDTDVAAAALAEARWGGSVGLATHAYITVGTGVGVGLIAGGRPVHGLLHPEAGHLMLRRAPGDRFTGSCPFHGDCIEGLISGPAIVARAGGAPTPPEHPLWGHVAHDLGELVATLLLVAAPERIAVGGGVGWGERAHLLPAAAAAAAARLGGYLPPHIDPARILAPAGLGEAAGPLGAVALALGALGR